MQLEGELINLRGHHLLCVRTFSGAGYDISFIDNMYRIVDACKSPSRPIRIVRGLDDICAFCPHSDGSSCLKDENRALSMDKAVLAALGIRPGGTYTSLYLQREVEGGIRRQLFHDICAQCNWFASHCHRIIA
ncbi:MAG: DUF1284 domain-containing protein [Actinobacteria bacterium]|nr:DUF1284 domain-containing protein [Actinomycetota bacterium]